MTLAPVWMYSLPFLQTLEMTLALLIPMLLLFTAVPRGILRLEASAVLLLLAFVVQTLSYVLALGPGVTGLKVAGSAGSALAASGAAASGFVSSGLGWLSWLSNSLLHALAVALLLALAFLRTPAVWIYAVLALLIPCTAWLLAATPDNPFFNAAQTRWEQGRFVHFYGLSAWINHLWLPAAWLYVVWQCANALRGTHTPSNADSSFG